MVEGEEKSDAFIFCRDGKFIVWPPVAKVDPGDAIVAEKQTIKFRIRNSTEFGTATVSLPVGRVENGSTRGNREKSLEPGQSQSFNLKRVNGPFEYIVMVDGQRATAASDPVIIIDPPCA